MVSIPEDRQVENSMITLLFFRRKRIHEEEN